jgi:hypothetical protein
VASASGELAKSGTLVSYGPNYTDMFRGIAPLNVEIEGLVAGLGIAPLNVEIGGQALPTLSR